MDTHGKRGAASAPGHALAYQAQRLGHSPLLTFYDDESGERTELSYATFENWAAKAANLLVEEFSAQAGDRVALGVTAHWTGAVLAAAAWKVGAVVVGLVAADDPAVITVVSEQDAAAQESRRHQLVVGTGFGGRVGGEVRGVPFDEVLAFADFFDGDVPDPSAPAVDSGVAAMSFADLLEHAARVPPEARLLTSERLGTAAGLVGVIAGPIAAGGSVVWCPHLPAHRTSQRAAQERATHTWVAGSAEPVPPSS